VKSLSSEPYDLSIGTSSATCLSSLLSKPCSLKTAGHLSRKNLWSIPSHFGRLVTALSCQACFPPIRQHTSLHHPHGTTTTKSPSGETPESRSFLPFIETHSYCSDFNVPQPGRLSWLFFTQQKKHPKKSKGPQIYKRKQHEYFVKYEQPQNISALSFKLQ